MSLNTAALLLGALACTVGGLEVDGYSKTEGAWVLSPNRRLYTVDTAADCAAKCNLETLFTCRAFIYIEKDQECWTAAANSMSESVLRRLSSVLYEKNDYLLECVNGVGTDYRGTKTKTKTGKVCQRWEAKYPHRPNMTPETHPRADLESNFCRNPDGDSGGPWCYTTDPDTRWEHCNVTSCTDEAVIASNEEDCYKQNGATYRGVTSETFSGRKCQVWNSQTPHKHRKTPENFPSADLKRNLCRNPDEDRAPWCYTMDPKVRWEYCSLEQCATKAPPTNAPKPPPPSTVTQAPTQRDCKVGNGETYRGPTSITALGVTCQAWSAQSPHQHKTFTPQSHRTKGLEGNSCRNPDNDMNGPWCYTTDTDKMWDYCSIPDCAGDNCGTPAVRPRRCYRMIRGCVSRAHSWPWQISLRTSSGVHFCGGTLIHPQWVVTAAHCLERSNKTSAYKVVLGIHSEQGNESSKQERNLEKLVLGPNGTDIALLKLSRPATINDKVLSACLPEKDFMVLNETSCYVTGWGETQGTGGDLFLRELGIPVIDNKICNHPSFLNNRVKDHEMCAGFIEGGYNECQGDSGGPLVCNSQNKWVLQGVASWGLGCQTGMKPGIFARVSKFVEWINQTITED